MSGDLAHGSIYLSVLKYLDHQLGVYLSCSICATFLFVYLQVYDSRRPGVPNEMQSRPMIPRTPAVAALAMAATEKRSMGVAVQSGVFQR